MSDTALTLNVPLSEADRAFLLIACGDITDDSTRSRPGAGELTAQGVLDLRARLKTATATAPSEGTNGCEAPEAALARYIDILRADESDAVTILSEDPKATGSATRTAIYCSGAWTGYDIRRFAGESVLQCLAKAVSARADLPRAPKTRYFPADFAPAYQTVAGGGLALPADPLSRISTLPGRHADPDAFAVNLRAVIDDDAEACGICDVVFITGDRCLTDISLGPVHARCCGPERESYVNLETGEPLADDTPIPTPWIWNADGTISPGAEAAA